MARSYSARDGWRNQPSFSVIWRMVGRSMRVPSSKIQMGRRAGIVHVLDAKLLAGVLVVAQLNPLKGDVASVQEIADGIGGRTPTLAVETDGSGLLHTQTLQLDRLG